MQLQDVAPGLSQQYTNFIDALQESIDNSVSAIVKNEDYFDEPTDREDDVVEICLSIIKEGDLVWFIVADNGPGIPYDTLQRNLFLLGDESSGDGILNNVGWGLKQAIAWFENQVDTNIDITDSARDSNFRIITLSEEDGLLSVGGPIDGSLQIYEEDEHLWTDGLQDDPLEEAETGTHVYFPCTFDRVDEDLWKQGPAVLSTRLHALQERLGLQYRDLLRARNGNRITIRYSNLDDDTARVYEVPALDLTYDTELDASYPLVDEFEVTADGVSYDVTYNRGMINYNKICEAAKKADDGLVTSGGRLRWYIPSEETAGVDIYANGRILMFGELDLFDRSYNPALNYFGGEVRIVPQDNSEEVPTENRKVAIDRGSEFWKKLAYELRELGVEEKRYDEDEDEEGGEDIKHEGDREGGGEEDRSNGEDGGDEETREAKGERGEKHEGEDEADEENNEGDEEGVEEDSSEEESDEKNESEEQGEDIDDKEDEDQSREDEERSGENTKSEEEGSESIDSVVEQLEDANPSHSFERQQSFDDAEVDLVETQDDGSAILWVIESKTAKPADAYTLAMVHNHYKRENNNLLEVRLVAPDASSAFNRDLDELKCYNDLHGKPYNLEYQPTDDI